MTSDKVSMRISICSSLDGKVRLTTKSGATFDARVIRSEYVPTVYIVEPIDFKITFGEYTPELLRVLGTQITAAERAEGEAPAPDSAKVSKALQWPTELAPKTTAAAKKRGEQALAELTDPEPAVRQAIDSGAIKGLATAIARLDAPARERLRTHAAETGAAEVLTSLLDDTADLARLLVLAAAKGKLFCVSALLTAGADPEAAAKLLTSDEVPRTALYQAVYNGHRAVVRRLIEAGARVTDSAAFTWPILRCPDAGTWRLLLAAGLDPDNRNNDGDPVLLSLGRNGHPEMVDALLAAGSDPNATYPDGSTLLLHAVDLASKTGSGTSISFIKNLLTAGADPNAGRLHGRSPLALALVVPHDTPRSIARWLTEAGAIAVEDPAAPPLPTLAKPSELPTWRARIDPALARAPHYEVLGVRFTPAADNTDSLEQAPSALPWTGLGSDIIAVARAKLEHLLGRPHDNGDNYKTTFEYRMLADHNDVTLAVHLADWKARELSISVAPHPDAAVRERITAALRELLDISPLAAFRDRFRYDDHAGCTYESDGATATSQLPKLR